MMIKNCDEGSMQGIQKRENCDIKVRNCEVRFNGSGEEDDDYINNVDIDDKIAQTF